VQQRLAAAERQAVALQDAQAATHERLSAAESHGQATRIAQQSNVNVLDGLRQAQEQELAILAKERQLALDQLQETLEAKLGAVVGEHAEHAEQHASQLQASAEEAGAALQWLRDELHSRAEASESAWKERHAQVEQTHRSLAESLESQLAEVQSQMSQGLSRNEEASGTARATAVAAASAAQAAAAAAQADIETATATLHRQLSAQLAQMEAALKSERVDQFTKTLEAAEEAAATQAQAAVEHSAALVGEHSDHVSTKLEASKAELDQHMSRCEMMFRNLSQKMDAQAKQLETDRAREEQRRLRELLERQQAELSLQAQEHASQMKAAMENKQQEMDAEIARHQRVQVRQRLSSSMMQLLGEGLAGVPGGLVYQFHKWKMAVHDAQEEREAAAAHRARVEAERQQLRVVLEAKEMEVQSQIVAHQQQYEEKLAEVRAQHEAESARKSEMLAEQEHQRAMAEEQLAKQAELLAQQQRQVDGVSSELVEQIATLQERVQHIDSKSIPVGQPTDVDGLEIRLTEALEAKLMALVATEMESMRGHLTHGVSSGVVEQVAALQERVQHIDSKSIPVGQPTDVDGLEIRLTEALEAKLMALVATEMESMRGHLTHVDDLQIRLTEALEAKLMALVEKEMGAMRGHLLTHQQLDREPLEARAAAVENHISELQQSLDAMATRHELSKTQLSKQLSELEQHIGTTAIQSTRVDDLETKLSRELGETIAALEQRVDGESLSLVYSASLHASQRER
jgi:hypothetical protein